LLRRRLGVLMARDVTRRKMATTAFLKSLDRRKPDEMRIAHLKTHHGFEA
jgi:hypothetical protein